MAEHHGGRHAYRELEIAEELDIPVYAADADAPSSSLYYNSGDAGFKYKDSAGTVRAASVGDHAPTHENSGSDEISVAGLSGDLADAQDPKAHTHPGGDITSQVGDADTVDGVDIPATIAEVLTNHNKAVHDALGIDADTIDGLQPSEIEAQAQDNAILWSDNFAPGF